LAMLSPMPAARSPHVFCAVGKRNARISHSQERAERSAEMPTQEGERHWEMGKRAGS